MKPSRFTPEIDALLSEEAERRARREHPKARTPTKVLAEHTGYAPGYIANIISRKRREIESRADVSRETSTRGQRNVNS